MHHTTRPFDYAFGVFVGGNSGGLVGCGGDVFVGCGIGVFDGIGVNVGAGVSVAGTNSVGVDDGKIGVNGTNVKPGKGVGDTVGVAVTVAVLFAVTIGDKLSEFKGVHVGRSVGTALRSGENSNSPIPTKYKGIVNRITPSRKI